MEQLVTSTPVKRGENLTDEQRQFLLMKIEQYKDSLTDKHNDLRTIHRKKQAWERITHGFNSCFANATRKRTTQQIQTWYKNEKARRRRLMLRHHQRKQQDQEAPFQGIEIKTDPHSPKPPQPTPDDDANESVESREVMRAYLGPSLPTTPLLDGVSAKSSAVAAAAAVAVGSHPAALLTQPPIRPVSFPMPFIAMSKTNNNSFPSTRDRPDSGHLACPLPPAPSEFPTPRADTSLDEAASPVALTDDGCSGGPSQFHHSEDFAGSTWPPHQLSGSEELKDEEPASFQKRLFDREMAMLATKEDCIRRYYERKEAVLAVKEQFYRLQILLLSKSSGITLGDGEAAEEREPEDAEASKIRP